MAQEGLEHLLERQQLRLAVDQRDHVDAEHRLERRLRVEVVEHHLGVLAAAQLDDDAHAVLVGLVAQTVARDAFDVLLADEVRDAFDEPRLVDLVRELGDDDGLPVALAARFLEVGAGPDRQTATTGLVGGGDLGGAVDDAGGREIGARHELHQVDERDLGVVEHREAGVHDLGEVVRRDVGRHADRDARGTVDQQVRDARGHHRRFGQRLVVVRDEVDGLAVDVREQLSRHARHAHFGVTHGRRHVAVDRAEVALAVDQQVAHRERLRHADDGVVHGGIAVRVVFADDIADDAGGFLVGLVVVVAQFAHRVEHAAVHGFQAVADIREGAADDHAHGVIEVGLPHLVLEIDGQDFARDVGH